MAKTKRDLTETISCKSNKDVDQTQRTKRKTREKTRERQEKDKRGKDKKKT